MMIHTGGWNIVTSKSLAQRILNEAEWMTFWESELLIINYND